MSKLLSQKNTPSIRAPILIGHIFVNIDRTAMKLVPLESSRSQLSNGAHFQRYTTDIDKDIRERSLCARIFVNIARTAMKLVPLESFRSQLSDGVHFIAVRSTLTKIYSIEVNTRIEKRLILRQQFAQKVQPCLKVDT